MSDQKFTVDTYKNLYRLSDAGPFTLVMYIGSRWIGRYSKIISAEFHVSESQYLPKWWTVI